MLLGLCHDLTNLYNHNWGCPQDSDDEAPPHERFVSYCNDVEGTAAWGGDMELNALSQALQRHFVVHCAGLPPVEFGTAHAGQGTMPGLLSSHSIHQRADAQRAGSRRRICCLLLLSYKC